MNREIKFRAWDGKTILDWISCKYHISAMLDIPSFTLMQYTGLKDKNGKEIYEGDIIKDCLTDMISVVKYGMCVKHAYNGWFVENESFNYVSQINADYDTNLNSMIEVIGNIYENPELLQP